VVIGVVAPGGGQDHGQGRRSLPQPQQTTDNRGGQTATPGLLKDLAGFLPACLTTVRRLRNDPRVPRRAKLVILLAGLWLLSPIDLLPEFLPVIGPLDDVLVIALALRYAARSVPRPVLLGAWPADPRLLERLLGPPARPTRPGEAA
jgi:uncharacterized membrane protein YkvA (DUF1232 family)